MVVHQEGLIYVYTIWHSWGFCNMWIGHYFCKYLFCPMPFPPKICLFVYLKRVEMERGGQNRETVFQPLDHSRNVWAKQVLARLKPGARCIARCVSGKLDWDKATLEYEMLPGVPSSVAAHAPWCPSLSPCFSFLFWDSCHLSDFLSVIFCLFFRLNMWITRF